MIKPAVLSDAEAIVPIYNHYILNTFVTFEEQAVSALEMAGRMKAVEEASLPWLVSEQANQVVGYAYAGKWHKRSAYRYSAECTVYLDPAVMGQGLGTELYEALFTLLRGTQTHTVLGVIALPNEASIALHEKFGLIRLGISKRLDSSSIDGSMSGIGRSCFRELVIAKGINAWLLSGFLKGLEELNDPFANGF